MSDTMIYVVQVVFNLMVIIGFAVIAHWISDFEKIDAADYQEYLNSKTEGGEK